MQEANKIENSEAMNYHVVVEKMCGCAKRKGMPQIRSCTSKEAARQTANAWANELNQVFCGKHGFDVVEVDDNYVIAVGEGSF